MSEVGTQVEPGAGAFAAALEAGSLGTAVDVALLALAAAPDNAEPDAPVAGVASGLEVFAEGDDPDDMVGEGESEVRLVAAACAPFEPEPPPGEHATQQVMATSTSSGTTMINRRRQYTWGGKEPTGRKLMTGPPYDSPAAVPARDTMIRT